jgi:hypothetical protein
MTIFGVGRVLAAGGSAWRAFAISWLKCHLSGTNQIGGEEPGSNSHGENRLTEKPFQIIIVHLPIV